MLCKSIAIGIAVFCLALAVRAEEQTTITVNKPVGSLEGLQVATRLGELILGVRNAVSNAMNELQSSS